MILFFHSFPGCVVHVCIMMSSELVLALECFSLFVWWKDKWLRHWNGQKQLANVKWIKSRRIKFPNFSLKTFFLSLLSGVFLGDTFSTRIVSGRIFSLLHSCASVSCVTRIIKAFCSIQQRAWEKKKLCNIYDMNKPKNSKHKLKEHKKD